MNPVAFTVFGLEIRWYGILMASGMLIASLILLHFATKRGYSKDLIYDFILVIIPSAVLGSRIWYVLFNLDYYQGDLLKMFNVREGGLAIQGGVIFGAIGGLIFCKRKKISFWELADMVSPGLILAQAIGRWGNFTNGEAHGGPTDLPWAITVGGEKVHPTFLYESLWNLLVFAVLIYMIRRKHFKGKIFLLYGILYSVGRFFIEGLRTDSLMIGGMRTAQLTAIVTILVFSGLYALRNRLKDQQVDGIAGKKSA